MQDYLFPQAQNLPAFQGPAFLGNNTKWKEKYKVYFL